MATADPLPIYEELLDLLADTADVDRLLAFRLSDQRQAQLEELLQRNRDGLLSESEQGELAEFERLEHLGRMLKARAAKAEVMTSLPSARVRRKVIDRARNRDV